MAAMSEERFAVCVEALSAALCMPIGEGRFGIVVLVQSYGSLIAFEPTFIFVKSVHTV